jgi:3-dehydroquinate dehydratase I
MRTLGELLTGEGPVVAASFTDADPPELIEQAQALGVDVAELRIDRFTRTDAPHVLGVVASYEALPTLATIRSPEEGGAWQGSESERLALYRQIVPVVQGIDIELSSEVILAEVLETAHRLERITVLSFHDFSATPSRSVLDALVERGDVHGADVVKIAVTPRTREDIREMARFTLDHADRNIITICMGDLGRLSRVLFPALGSRLTFTHLGTASAPGQISAERMCGYLRDLYR